MSIIRAGKAVEEFVEAAKEEQIMKINKSILWEFINKHSQFFIFGAVFCIAIITAAIFRLWIAVLLDFTFLFVGAGFHFSAYRVGYLTGKKETLEWVLALGIKH